MTSPDGILAVDGHDAAGKTTIARALAEATGGTYVRPFGGGAGEALMAAANTHDPAQVLAIGHATLAEALTTDRPAGGIVLDRSWMTVASLVNLQEFSATWTLWIPTVLCWSDLPTTLERLGTRDEVPEDRSWHVHYLARYEELARVFDVPVIRTDSASVAECVRQALDIAGGRHER